MYSEMTDKQISEEITKRLYPGATETEKTRIGSNLVWPVIGALIQDKKICLNYVWGDGWFACGYFNQWLNDMQFTSNSPLRAAAEVWLMMDDKEKGNE